MFSFPVWDMTYYDELARGYDELHREEQVRKLRIIQHELPIAEEDAVLDVGCGTGVSAILPGTITGIDPAEKLARQAPFKAIVGRAEELPFPDGSFDVIVCVTAIHHVDDVPRALREMARVGKDRFGFSVLKRAARFAEIERAICGQFSVVKTIDEGTDVIFICKGI